MDVFKDYSKYYDLLYQDKDYQGEADFVDSLLKDFTQQKISSLLDLGCGTGKHALALAKKGYTLLGVDQSVLMLELAGNLIAKTTEGQNIRLEKGDVRNVTLAQKVDAAISLFHVASYQTTYQDLQAMFASVKNSVKKGGLFIFDCWYGPAVLEDKPAVRFKTFQNETLRIERVSVPKLDVNANKVEVNYHLYISSLSLRAQAKQSTQEQDVDCFASLARTNEAIYQKIEESHTMRYWFLPEIEKVCLESEFTLLSAFEWMTKMPLSDKTFGATFVVKV